MKLSTLKQSAARKILIYGAPKTGKTELYGGLAKEKRLHVFDLEQSTKTFLKESSAAYPYLESINVYPLPDMQTFPVAIGTILAVTKNVKLSICHKHGMVGCKVCKDPASFSEYDPTNFTPDDVVVVDSISQLAASAMNHIMRNSIAKDDFEKKPEWDNYAAQGAMMDRFGSWLQNAPFSIVCVSHETMVEMEDGTKKIVPIGGTSNFSKTFAKYFDDVVYCEIVNGKYVATCSAEDKTRVVVGSRSGRKLRDEKKQQLPLLELFK